MKYLVILGDGMADLPLPELAGKTPLAAAETPWMDWLARHGEAGMVRTVPQGMAPGSDIANLSVLGYAPERYFSGRSPLEAVSLGLALQPGDVCFRCNLVTLSEEENYPDRRMVDYCAGEIPTEEARQLLADLSAAFAQPDLALYPGISYRHCLVLHGAETGTTLCPPHDSSGRPSRDHLPGGRCGERLYDLMVRSWEILRDHPVNRARKARGENPANSVWFWGEGTAPSLDPLHRLYGVRGGMVCAVDLLRGLGLCAGLRTLCPPGATGAMVTDYRGKGRAALDLLGEDLDFVYLHVGAPDECGHHGDLAAKLAAIEAIDREIVGPALEELTRRGEEFAILLTPDHPTPLAIRIHTGDPVPFVIYRSGREGGPHAAAYSEEAARATGLFLPAGPMLMQRLTGKYLCAYQYEEKPAL